GNMVMANPGQAAPELHIPLPVTGRYSVAVGMPENYCDRLLIKLARENFVGRLAHGEVGSSEPNQIQEVWWRDLDLREDDVLIVKQDAGMRKRCSVAFIRLYPAPPPTAPEVPFFT